MPGVSDKAPALSVGLAVRNARDVLGRCIESVLSQDFTDLELVICDNVSDDGTITMLENSRPLRPAHRAQRQRGEHRLSREYAPGAWTSPAARSFAGSALTTGWSQVASRHACARSRVTRTPSV